MIKVIHESEPKPGTLGKPELYALAIGQVIGAGVITLIVPAIKMTGYSAWLAYFVAILVGFVMIAPTVFVSATLRLGGGGTIQCLPIWQDRRPPAFSLLHI